MIHEQHSRLCTTLRNAASDLVLFAMGLNTLVFSFDYARDATTHMSLLNSTVQTIRISESPKFRYSIGSHVQSLRRCLKEVLQPTLPM